MNRKNLLEIYIDTCVKVSELELAAFFDVVLIIMNASEPAVSVFDIK